MASMKQLRGHPWFIFTALGVVSLAAVSMHVERMTGWGLLIVCFW